MAGSRRQPLASPFLLIQGGTRAKVRTLTITGATLTDNGGGEAELVISGGGGGAWTLTGITGTANRIAGFNGAGAAAYYQIGVDLQAWDADLDALAALGNGLPYRSGGTWGAYGLGDLSISAGSILVDQARGLRETGGPTTLTMGAVADGRLLARNGTTLGGVSVSTGLTLSAGALAVDTTTIATLAAVAAAYQPLDAGLTSLTAADATAGLPYVTGANTWATATLGDLYVSGGAWRVTGLANLPTTDQKSALAGSYGSPSGSNKYVTQSDPVLTGTGGATGGAGAVAAYGQGRDGDAAFDGVNPVTNWSLAGSTYTYTGIEDAHLAAVTIATGVTLKTQGFCVFMRSLSVGNNVIFDGRGTAASGITAGTGALPAAIATSIAGATFYGGEDGANGRNSNAAGLSAPSISAAALRGGGIGGSSGRARLTSISAIASAGPGGSGTSTRLKQFYYGDPFKIFLSGLPFYRNGTAIAQVAGGTGGGGAPLSTTGTSGGGGGGAGVFAFAIATAEFGTGCQFLLDGMSGGDGAAGANSGGGGGGGGGGGVGVCVIGEITGSNVPTFYARGGAGGAGSIAGTGLWAEGGNGGEGGAWWVYFGTTPATPTIVVTGGAGGANAGSGTGFTGSVAGADGTYDYGSGS